MAKRGRKREKLAERAHDFAIAQTAPKPDEAEGWRTAERIGTPCADIVCDLYNTSRTYPAEDQTLWSIFRFAVDAYAKHSGAASKGRVPTTVQKVPEAIQESRDWDAEYLALCEHATATMEARRSRLNPKKYILGLSGDDKEPVKYITAAKAEAVAIELLVEKVQRDLLVRTIRRHWQHRHEWDFNKGCPTVTLTDAECDELADILVQAEWLERLEDVEYDNFNHPGPAAWVAQFRNNLRLKEYLSDNGIGAAPPEQRWLHALVVWICYLRARRHSGSSVTIPHVRLCAADDCQEPAFIEKYAGKVTQGEFYCPLCRDDKDTKRKRRHRHKTGSMR